MISVVTASDFNEYSAWRLAIKRKEKGFMYRNKDFNINLHDSSSRSLFMIVDDEVVVNIDAVVEGRPSVLYFICLVDWTNS